MDNRNNPESIEEKLERLGACGMGYPSLGLPCIRPKGHSNPISQCFALVETNDSNVWGVYMDQDSKTWTQALTQFPTDLVVSKPLMKREIIEQIPDRKAAIAHTKALS